MQDKSRNEKGNGRKELKIGVACERWAPGYPFLKEYKSIGKMVYAGYHKPDKFQALREAKVVAKYNVDEIKYRILNGDGASWIKYDHDTETGIFQLDPCHLSQSIIRNVSDKKARHHPRKWLKASQFDKAYTKLDELRYECDGLLSEIKN